MNLEDTLLNYVAAPNGCWLWLGSTTVWGYGQVNLNHRMQRVHRVVLEQKLGRPIRPKHCALHHCDTPRCMRAEHLYEGTNDDNIADCVRRGRRPKGDDHGMRTHPHRRPFGERHGMVKLTEEKVRRIRTDPMRPTKMARLMGVSPSTIADIRYGRSWRHIL